MDNRAGKHVDRVFRLCLLRNIRHRDAIVERIKAELAQRGMDCPPDYTLHVMISRSASRTDPEGRRRYFPVYGSRRYLDLEHMDRMVRVAEAGGLDAPQADELRAQLADLEQVARKWQAKVAKAAEVRTQLQDQLVRAHVGSLALTPE